MRVMTSIAMLLVAGLAVANEQVISVQHDSHRGVTCWITPQGGISCLPDASLLQVPGPAPTGESQAARASLDSNTAEIESFSAVSLPQSERFQL